MTRALDLSQLTRLQLIELRAESAHQSDLARMAAGLAKGRRKARMLKYAAQHHANMMHLADLIDGLSGQRPVSSAVERAALQPARQEALEAAPDDGRGSNGE